MAKSSAHWKRQQAKDFYIKEAKALGYRSRASFKLIELDDKHRLFKPNNLIIDLGASPGSWSQYASSKIGKNGRVIACDLLPMEPLDKVTFIQGDFTSADIQAKLLNETNHKPVNLVISDLAPNLSGIDVRDQSESLMLSDKALSFTLGCLAVGGHFVIKLFQQPDAKPWLDQLKKLFKTVRQHKPRASRSRSQEFYAVALGLKKLPKTSLAKPGLDDAR